MIYLDNIQDAQTALIPKSREKEGSLVLVLRSTIGKDYPVNDIVIGIDTSSRFFNISFVLPEDIAEGEHEYRLSDSLGVLSEGLAIVGGKTSPREYDKTITYEQYKAD